MQKAITATTDHIYLQVAGGIEKMIDEEVLKIGDKLPSVRMLSEEYGISMGTAFQAYYHLEGKGLIESRPKSGYYVRFNHKRFPAMPKQLQPEPVSHDVSVKEMIASIYTDITAHDVINFALAVPDISLLPAAKLNKSVVYALRNSNDHCINYEHTQGNIELRKQIAKLAFNWGGKIKPEEIVVTNGCLEAIMICLKTVTRPGDTVAIECDAAKVIETSIPNKNHALCRNVNPIESPAAVGINVAGRAIKESRLGWYRVYSGKDINPAPAIDVVWWPCVAAQGRRDKDSCVIQSCATRIDLIL